jgi:hypothetical protein
LTDWSSGWKDALYGLVPEKTVTQKGRDIYEVVWSTEITTAKSLKKGRINEIRHIGLTMQPA